MADGGYFPSGSINAHNLKILVNFFINAAMETRFFLKKIESNYY